MIKKIFAAITVSALLVLACLAIKGHAEEQTLEGIVNNPATVTIQDVISAEHVCFKFFRSKVFAIIPDETKTFTVVCAAENIDTIHQVDQTPLRQIWKEELEPLFRDNGSPLTGTEAPEWTV